MIFERDYSSIRALMAKAMAAGATRLSMGHFEWDMSGDCESAKRMEYFARPPATMVKGVVKHVNVPGKPGTPAKVVRALVRSNEPGATWVQPRNVIIDSMFGLRPNNRARIAAFGPAGVGGTSEWTTPGRTSIWVSQIVRCGKCAPCLRVRRRKWAARMHVECKRSYRVWSGNIQLRPEQHYLVKVEAAQRYDNDKRFPNRKAGDFDALPQTARFERCHRIISEEITRWLKRIRHTTKSGVRICVIREVHEGGGRNHGLPHYHVLIHQTEQAQITKAVLEDRWRWGFSHWRLVEEKNVNKAVGYLCKYLSKSMAGRVRASIGYGKYIPAANEVQQRNLLVAEQNNSVWPPIGYLIHEHALRGVDSGPVVQQTESGSAVCAHNVSPVQDAGVCKHISKSDASRTSASLGFETPSSDIARACSDSPCVQTNDPPNLLSSLEREQSDREGNMGWPGLAGTVAVGLNSKLYRYYAMLDNSRSAADARLGGPGRVAAYTKLAAKGNARRNPALAGAPNNVRAPLGHSLSPIGPFDYPSDSDVSDGPLSACMRAGRASGSIDGAED